MCGLVSLIKFPPLDLDSMVSPLFLRSRVYAYLDVTCNLHLGQNNQGLLHATVVTRKWNGHQESAHKVDSGEENSPATPAGLNLQPFDHESDAILTSYPQTRTAFIQILYSLLVRAPDLRSKGCEFESWQKQQENFLLQSILCADS